MKALIQFSKIRVLGAALFCSLGAGSGSAENLLTELDRHIEQVRADWKNVGVAVAVVQGDKVIYAPGFGVREAGNSAQIDAETLFQVGSTSKAFTTAAMGILVEEGKLHWDDPVIDHLPGFQLQDPWLTRNLTIRATVTHRSGLGGSFCFALGIMDSNEVVGQLRYVKPEAPFRDSFGYSNLMYGVAGKYIEAASGMSWHEGTSAYEFWAAAYVAPTYLGSAPAGIPGLEDARDAKAAMPHGWDERGSVVVLPWQSYHNAAAAGAVVSSAADMVTWLLLHLKEVHSEGQQLLRKKTVQDLHAKHNLHPIDTEFRFSETRGYAMGWRRAEYRNQVHLSHGAGIVGFPAYVALLPDRKIGIVVLSNGPQGALAFYYSAIAFWVLDRLLGAPPHDWNKELLSSAQNVKREYQKKEDERQQSRHRNAPPSLALEQYAGVYEDKKKHSGRGNVHVDNGQLRLSFAGHGAFSAHLEHWHSDLFRLEPNPGVADVIDSYSLPFVGFTLDAAGSAASMSAFGKYGGTFQY